MRIVAISDVHEQWDALDLPAGDLLVVAGDLCERRDESFVAADAWFAGVAPRYSMGAKYVPGNHDGRIMDPTQERKYRNLAPHLFDAMLIDKTVEIDGLTLHAMPWDFGERDSPESLIPEGLDVLVTHEPPEGILDWSPRARDDRLGNRMLRRRVAVVKPRVHLFGHCHMAYGTLESDGTLFANVSICGDPKSYYSAAHPATIVESDQMTVSATQWR